MGIDTGAEAAGQLNGVVGAAGVEDDNFIRPANGAQTIRQQVGGVLAIITTESRFDINDSAAAGKVAVTVADATARPGSDAALPPRDGHTTDGNLHRSGAWTPPDQRIGIGNGDQAIVLLQLGADIFEVEGMRTHQHRNGVRRRL